MHPPIQTNAKTIKYQRGVQDFANGGVVNRLLNCLFDSIEKMQSSLEKSIAMSANAAESVRMNGLISMMNLDHIHYCVLQCYLTILTY